MAPGGISASKAKRKAKQANKGSSLGTVSTPAGSTLGSEASTPITSLSANASTDDLNAMAKLRIATDRCAYIYSFFLCIIASLRPIV